MRARREALRAYGRRKIEGFEVQPPHHQGEGGSRSVSSSQRLICSSPCLLCFPLLFPVKLQKDALKCSLSKNTSVINEVKKKLTQNISNH